MESNIFYYFPNNFLKFTILKADKLSMVHFSPFYTNYDNSITNNTFSTDMLRQNNNTKFTPMNTFINLCKVCGHLENH